MVTREPVIEWFHGETGGIRGWYAPRYGALAPCHEAVLTIHGEHVTCVTLFSRMRTSQWNPWENSWTLKWNDHQTTLPHAADN